MLAFLRFLMLLALVVWLGGILFFGAVLAPTLFSTLPKREMAGAVVTKSLAALHWIGIGAGLLFLLCSLVSARVGGTAWGPRNWQMVAMLALTLVSQFGVTPKMVALRKDMVEIDSVSADDPRRIEFNQLHRYSTAIEGGVLFLGIMVLWDVAVQKPPQ